MQSFIVKLTISKTSFSSLSASNTISIKEKIKKYNYEDKDRFFLPINSKTNKTSFGEEINLIDEKGLLNS
jgi:hypothetical protein